MEMAQGYVQWWRSSQLTDGGQSMGGYVPGQVVEE
jgi:hypothetical protein